MCADILPFCHTRVSSDDNFAIHEYRTVWIRRVHRRHRGWPRSAFSGFYFYGSDTIHLLLTPSLMDSDSPFLQQSPNSLPYFRTSCSETWEIKKVHVQLERILILIHSFFMCLDMLFDTYKTIFQVWPGISRARLFSFKWHLHWKILKLMGNFWRGHQG